VQTKIVISAGIALLWFFVLGMFAHAQDQPAKVADNWEMDMETPQGSSVPFTVSIEQDGSKIKGKMNSEFAGDSAINGTINEKDLAFRSTPAGPNGDLYAIFK